MKLSNLLMIIILGLFISTAHATETLPEKSETTKNDIKRDANKAIDRVDEATCTGTDAECAKRKIENRAEEGKDLIKDKSSEIKNKID
ncbi:MAG: YtxH domain-containing protein [Nitrosomonas sp.]|nr:YtxH domain-containing protein [Nitrosomonas sp.]